MSTIADVPTQRGNWLARAENWLDARGKAAWIAAMVVGFIAFWPIGLALLAFMLFRGKFGETRTSSRAPRFMTRGSSGNAAFDAYRNETLRRLEDEQKAFESFLERLREAKDKAEFDEFMKDRAARHDEERPVEA
ncbi:DUF2852 domain-containing protein [Palleronia sp. LCG004]|uniref:DUF2852 domain-containing protein n=1 Tax=Palleronia sp. LCG004 TaxID=3079304 RepID=UPI002942E3E7|nr:DUF2852 domain-containing protein [Palleronia sp. LCG004]WOI55186.1 DUF2852 domain-containing protein [Palleronia sp. LCG004]